MISHTNILIKGQWYGCRNGSGYPIGADGAWGSPIDNTKFGHDIHSGAVGVGRPEMGKSGCHGIFCDSGLYSNGDQGKEKA